MNFLKNIVAAFIGVGLFFGIIFLLFMAMAAAFGGNSKSDITVNDASILRIKLDQPIKDYGGKFEIELINQNFKEHTGLSSILSAIKHAKTDDRIKAISIEAQSTPIGLAHATALRNGIIDFKESGKKVFAYGDFFTQTGYYISTAADNIYMNPAGEMELKGLSSEVLYFKDLEEKSGVTMEVIRHGKYKSAVEPFLYNKMSDDNRTQIKELLQSAWGTIAEGVAASRGLTVPQINTIADSLLARSPELALKNNLVNHVDYYDVYLKDLITAAEIKTEEAKDPKFISIKKYATHVGENKKGNYSKDKIAIVYAQGEIQYGKGDEDVIGQEIVIEALKKARDNKKVKAIVLRVNSPGGSALASELIWREVERTKAIKPVVVSMGNYAASGGYYIACNAHHIIAEPSTITGSIGVFGVLPNFKKLADRIGINAEQVKTHEQSEGYSPFEPLNQSFKKTTTESIERIYKTFVEHVSTGREMSYEAVDAIAQGRVWTGTDALRLGLVDALGGLDAAVVKAAEIANTSEYTTKEYPVYKKDFSEIISRLGGIPFLQSQEELLKNEIGVQNYALWKKLKSLTNQQGVQARIPFILEIK